MFAKKNCKIILILTIIIYCIPPKHILAQTASDIPFYKDPYFPLVSQTPYPFWTQYVDYPFLNQPLINIYLPALNGYHFPELIQQDASVITHLRWPFQQRLPYISSNSNLSYYLLTGTENMNVMNWQTKLYALFDVWMLINESYTGLYKIF